MMKKKYGIRYRVLDFVFHVYSIKHTLAELNAQVNYITRGMVGQ